MNRETVDGWLERGILALVLAILILGPLALGAVRGLEFGIIEVLTAGVLLLWLARLWISPRPQLLWPPICWSVVAFAAYAIIRYRTADIEYVARMEMLRVLVYGFLFLAILNNLYRQESIQVMVFTLMFVAMAISFYAMYQFVTDSDRVWTLLKPYKHRGSGTYFCPDHLAGFLEVLLPLALAFTITGRIKPLTRVLLGYAALVILGGIAVTLSRGGWLSTSLALAGLLVILIFQRGYRISALVALACLAIVALVIVPKSFAVQVRLRRLVGEGGAVDDSMRFALWRPAYRMWQDHLWWGVGPGHFDARFRAYRPEGIQQKPERVHNDYLNTLADWGITGAALVASAWLALGIGVVSMRRAVRLSSSDLGGRSGSNKFAFVAGASMGLLAILVHSWVDFNMHIPANAILVVTLMALLSSHLRFATERWWLRAGLPWQLMVSAVLLAGAAYLSPQARRQILEFASLRRAEQAPAFSPAEIERLKGAFAVEPKNSATVTAIAEDLQHQSQEGGTRYPDLGGVSYRDLAQEAMLWYERGIKLDRWDSRNYSGVGWCLDWLGRQAESGPYFDHAEELDPNNYFNMNNIGFHYIQLGDFAAARPWFERSLRLEYTQNPIAQNYLTLVNARLLEAATNEIRGRLDAVAR